MYVYVMKACSISPLCLVSLPVSLEASMELSLLPKLQRTPKGAIPVAFALFLLLTLTPALYPLFAYPSFLLKTSSRPPPSVQRPSEHHNPSFDRSPPSDHQTPLHDRSPVHKHTSTTGTRVNNEEKECDLFTGEWVPNPDAPYYTNMTCWAIHEHQNCMKYGRPDTEFMKWRWKPDGCEMPVFDPNEFLGIVRGKSMGFVGDSISRNQVQSLLCLLSRVEYPIDVSSTSDTDFRKWKYLSYNFTVHALWSPFLVRHTEADTLSPDKSGLFNLYLDEFNPEWTTKIDQLDYLVISSGHWFFRPVVFYENQQIVGCHYCGLPNVNPLPLYYGYRKALRTSLKTIVNNFKGLAFLRSFSPPHFEGGPWNKGGDCVRTRPYRRNETVLGGADLELHNIQLEEFRAAEEEGRKKGLRLRLIEVTWAMLLRPDGHPGRHGHLPNANVTLFKDCVHWCLPGPVDTWNDFLLQMLKMDETKQYNEKGKQLHSSNMEQLP